MFSRNATHTSDGIIIFVRQGLSFSQLSTSSLSSLDPYSDYVGVNISKTTPPLSLFLMFMLLLFALLCRMAKLTPFLPPFFTPPEISSLWETSIAITLSGTQKVLLTLVGRKYLIGSSLLTSSPSITVTFLLIFIAPLAVAPPLTFPWLPPPSPFLAYGRCFRT